MMPELGEYLKVAGALAMLAGVFDWLRGGSQAEDDMYAACADIVLDAVGDADNVNKIDVVTVHNLRDQVTVGEALDLDRERKLRGWWGRN